MKDNAIDGVAEFLLKEEEIRRTLERDATATRLDYYFGTTWKPRLFVFLAIIAIASVGVLAFRNGEFWVSVGMLAAILIASEFNRIERKMNAIRKLHELDRPEYEENARKDRR